MVYGISDMMVLVVGSEVLKTHDSRRLAQCMQLVKLTMFCWTPRGSSKFVVLIHMLSPLDLTGKILNILLTDITDDLSTMYILLAEIPIGGPVNLLKNICTWNKQGIIKTPGLFVYIISQRPFY